MVVSLSASSSGHILLLRRIFISVSGVQFCFRLSKPQGAERPEGIDQLMKITKSCEEEMR
jgi:hypothetical protein